MRMFDSVGSLLPTNAMLLLTIATTAGAFGPDDDGNVTTAIANTTAPSSDEGLDEGFLFSLTFAGVLLLMLLCSYLCHCVVEGRCTALWIELTTAFRGLGAQHAVNANVQTEAEEEDQPSLPV